MEFLAFLLSVGALIWASKNHSAHRELQDNQRLLQRELARLRDQLTQPATAPAAPQAAPPKEPIREKPPVVVMAPPPPQRPVERPIPPPRLPQASKPAIDWEGLVGVRLFSWIAGIALVLAAIFFLKYSIDHGWLSPAVRMVIGLVVGNALLLVCELKVARRYAVTANALDGAGIAILFATFFAAYSLWSLIGGITAFAMMALVTAVAVLLSLHHNSLFVAVLGLVGGFATPALLTTGENRPIGLFSYLLLLNAGLAWVAYRKRWPHLTALSTVFTTIYQWGWVMKFLETGSVPLALGIFMVFPVLSVAALTLGEKRTPADTHSPWFQHTSAITSALPMFFAMYMASVPGFGSRYGLLFGFVLLLDVGLTTIAAKRGAEGLHIAGAVGTLATVFAWLQVSYQSAAWPVVLGFVGVFVAFYLAAGYWIRFKDVGARGVLAAPLLLVAFPVLTNIEPAAANPGTLFVPLFAMVGGIALYSVNRREALAHHLAAVFVLATEIVWSVKYLDAETLYSALFIYSIFALFYLVVPLLRPEFERGNCLALSGHALLLLVVFRQSLAVPPWPFFIALGILDVAIAAAALRTRRSELHSAALAASQVLLICWQVTAQASPWPATAIVSAMLVAALGVGCFLFHRAESMASASAVASLLGIGVALAAVMTTGAPGIPVLATGLFVLSCFVLVVDGLAEIRFLAPFTVLPTACVLLSWSVRHFVGTNWSDELLLAAVVHVVFLGYPLLTAISAKKAVQPWLAAVLSSAAFFLFARHSLLAGGFENVIGILPVTQAALMSVLLWRLLKLEPAGERTLGRLALVAGTVLAFITVAIPLQLEKQWITIGWALQAAALAWLSRKIPHKGLVIWTTGLLAAVFVRLVLNPAVLTYHPRSDIPVLNWYLYTYLVAAAAFFSAAWFLRNLDGLFDDQPRIAWLTNAAGAVLLFLLLNIEIADYYSVGPTLTFNFSAGLAQDLSYTIGWGLFAFAMLIAGIVLATRAARIAAILLLSVTVAKCFLHDLWNFGGLYRVGSFVGLAVCLTLVALLLQKFVLVHHRDTEGPL